MLSIHENDTAVQCDVCGAESNVIVRPDCNNMPMCATCSSYHASSHDAIQHLKAAIRPIIAEWRAHWFEAGLSKKTVENLGDIVFEDLARETQP
jgi:hypothetical protein